jgi:phosphoribosylformylglycinamidine synthase
VAEACRNLVCTGATPLALTDCLNFGDPERPEVAYQLEQCVRGIAQACRALGVPVVSGNVSLYNESEGRPIYPTPVIGALGLLEDVEHRCASAFRDVGDVVVLLGAASVEGEPGLLAGSEVLELAHGLVAGRPSIDLELEARVQRCCLRLIRDGLARSAHDCADGGLAVAVAESAMLGGLGFKGTLAPEGRWDAALFGENPSRIVVSLSEASLAEVERMCREEGVPSTLLGTVGGDRFTVPGLVDLPLADLDDAWRHGLERALR